MAKPFTLKITITVDDPDVQVDIEQTAVKLFGQDLGDDESPTEFLARRLETYVLDFYSADKANDAGFNATQSTRDSIKAAATISKPKNKPKAETAKQ